MTLEQLQELKEELNKWRSDRKINIEDQLERLVGYVLEESSEYKKHIGDIHEELDALTDISVLLLNTEKVTHEYVKVKKFKNPVFNFVLRDIYILDKNVNMKTITRLFNNCISMIYSKGYDPYICLKEVLKQNNTRIGKINPKTKKFEKDESPEAKAKWYTPDFNNAKLK